MQWLALVAGYANAPTAPSNNLRTLDSKAFLLLKHSVPLQTCVLLDQVHYLSSKLKFGSKIREQHCLRCILSSLNIVIGCGHTYVPRMMGTWTQAV